MENTQEVQEVRISAVNARGDAKFRLVGAGMTYIRNLKGAELEKARNEDRDQSISQMGSDYNA